MKRLGELAAGAAFTRSHSMKQRSRCLRCYYGYGKEEVMKRGLAVIAVVVMTAWIGAAQQSTILNAPKEVITIPFQFYIDGDLLPAGTYEFTPGALGTHVELRNVQSERTLVISVLTSVSLRNVNGAQAVFDVVGPDHYLSELYFKGMDGFAFNGAPTKHTHQIVESATK